jgi:hypothetical protein
MRLIFFIQVSSLLRTNFGFLADSHFTLAGVKAERLDRNR